MKDRIFLILMILLDSEEFITIDRIAKELSVSNKTIRNELIKLDEWLITTNLKLNKKTGSGIMLKGSIQDKFSIRQEITEMSKVAHDFSPQHRMNSIAIKLLGNKESLRVYNLAEEFYSSRATIHKDLEKVGNLLGKYKIELIRKKNHGLTVSGKERHIRTCLVDLILNDSDIKNLVDMVIGVEGNSDEDILLRTLQIKTGEMRKFLLTIRNTQNQYLEGLPLQTLVNILIMIFVTMRRYQMGYTISLSESFLKNLEGESFYEDVEQICENLKTQYGIILPEIEKRYLQVYFVGQSKNFTTPSSNENEANDIANALISKWEDEIGQQMVDREELLESLVLHLIPAITRFKHGILVENPVLADIKKVHKYTFGIVMGSVEFIEKKFDCIMTDEEVGFLTLHLALGLDKMKKPLNTVLVSHVGVGASKLLQERLITQIPEIKIFSMESYYSIYDSVLEEVDLIISTIQLKLPKVKNIIYINPLIYDDDVMKIRNMIKPIFNLKNDPYEKEKAPIL